MIFDNPLWGIPKKRRETIDKKTGFVYDNHAKIHR